MNTYVVLLLFSRKIILLVSKRASLLCYKSRSFRHVNWIGNLQSLQNSHSRKRIESDNTLLILHFIYFSQIISDSYISNIFCIKSCNLKFLMGSCWIHIILKNICTTHAVMWLLSLLGWPMLRHCGFQWFYYGETKTKT